MRPRRGRLFEAPPDFVGVGAQRAGTSWWFVQLLGHAQVCQSRLMRKETHFFDRFGAEPMTDAHIAAYADLFPREPGQIAGEWTPRYMSDPWTPRLLRRAAPDAKLLVLLRDPVERYRSGVVHRVRATPERRPGVVAADALERGRYATHLRGLRACFDPNRILVLQYERCRADPEGELRRTFAFLGLEPRIPRMLRRAIGGSMTAAKPPLDDDLAAGLRAALAPELADLATLAPDLDLSLWPSAAS
ncbi:MAG TPA: sulfotransferase [Capillimicrobium sp.]